MVVDGNASRPWVMGSTCRCWLLMGMRAGHGGSRCWLLMVVQIGSMGYYRRLGFDCEILMIANCDFSGARNQKNPKASLNVLL